MNTHDGLKVVEEIESLIAGFGSPNDEALSRVKCLVSSLRQCSNNHHFTEKLDSLEGWAETGFSASKFQRWGGADRVRDFARADCMAIKRAIRKWDEAEANL